MRPISLAVDVTNYVMLDLGQPLHAYDLATGRAPIVVRRADAGRAAPDARRRRPRARPRGPAHHRQPRRSARRRGPSVSRASWAAATARSARRRPTCSSRPPTSTRSRSPARRAGTSCRARRPSGSSVVSTRGCRRSRSRATVALLVELGGGVADAAVTRRRPSRARAVVRARARPARAARRPAVTRPTRCARRCGRSAATVDRRRCATRSRVTAAVVAARPRRPASTWSRRSRACAGYDAIPSMLPVAPGGRGPDRGPARPALGRAGAGRGRSRRGAQLPVRRDRPARRARPARRRRPSSRGAAGQPALRRAAVPADQPAGHAARHRAAQRRPRRDATSRSSRSAWSRGRSPGAPAAPRLPGGVRPSDEDLAAIDAAVPPQPRRVAGVLAGLREPAGWWGPGRRADHTDAIAAARLVAEVVGRGARRVGRRRPRAVAPGSVRAPDDGGRHPRRARGRAAPERRRPRSACRPGRSRSSSTSTCCSARRRPSRPGGAGVDVPRRQGGRRARGRRVGAGRRRARRGPGRRGREPGRATSSRRSGCSTSTPGTQVGDGHKSLAFSLRLRAADRTLTAQESAAVRDVDRRRGAPPVRGVAARLRIASAALVDHHGRRGLASYPDKSSDVFTQ